MSEENCPELSCGCGQGYFSELVQNTVEVFDYLCDQNGVPFVVENYTGSGLQIIDGEFLELN
jgi:hypothetical protein